MSRPAGWEASAAAWIAHLGADGDFARRHVLDAPMLARIRGRGFVNALDVGCGEGRFCRRLKAEGLVDAIGVDPTEALIAEARRRDPDGDYRVGRAEALAFGDASFDLVVSYLALLDIEDAGAAIAEMARVLRPGGAIVLCNQNGFATASPSQGWRRSEDGSLIFEIDRYLEPRALVSEWRGVSVRNFHRPLEFYMQAFLSAGLRLACFAEPAPHGGEAAKRERYTRVPLFVLMEWRKV